MDHLEPQLLEPRARSYLDTAAHGITALDAISTVLAGKPWLPPFPSIA
jgi:hypothetical protein